MQAKTLVVLSILMIAGTLWFALGGREDRAVLNELARRQVEQETAASDRDALASTATTFRLSNRLTAEQVSSDPLWLVERRPSGSSLELPFRPLSKGSLPAQEASIRSQPDDAQTLAYENPGYLGAAACAECHIDKYSGFTQTAHHQTSGNLTAANALGRFASPANQMVTEKGDLEFLMTKRDNRVYQQASLEDWKMEFPMDIVTGSGKVGQSYLYWLDDKLYQLHVSYLTGVDEWVTSPGYAEDTAHYARKIGHRCLECHTTWIAPKTQGDDNVYYRDSAIWGISCERCHGPGREHVEFHRRHPEARTAKYVTHPGDLPRQRQLDICGQCHSGSFMLLQDAFSYRPGQDLSEYHKLYDQSRKEIGGIHTSNQLMRMSMSECFKQSNMTCTSCHNPHKNQRGDVAAFTASCLNCHESQHCGMSDQLGDRITQDCVSCHMPMSDNEGMSFEVSKGSFNVQMVDHYIRVDREATAKVLDE